MKTTMPAAVFAVILACHALHAADVPIRQVEKSSAQAAQWQVLERAKLATVSPVSGPRLSIEGVPDMAIDQDSVYVASLRRVMDRDPAMSELNYSNMCWALEKLGKDNGISSEDFGRNGIVLTYPGKEPNEGRVIAVDDHNLYVAAGFSVSGCTLGTPESYWRIEKRDQMTGQLVPGFGKEGVVSSPDKAFGRGWMRSVVDIAVVGGHVYVLGSERTWTTSWSVRIEKRDKTTGELVPEFGNGGVVLSLNPDYALDMEIIGDALFVIGKNVISRAHYSGAADDDFDWHIEKRSTASGALVAGFGTMGVLRHNPTPRYEQPEAIMADAESIYIIGHDNCAGSGQWRIEKRDVVEGRLVETFGGGGVIVTNAGPWCDCAEKIVADADHLYIAGQERLRGFALPDWRIEKRDKRTGELIEVFGHRGVLRQDGSGSRLSQIFNIEVDEECLFLLMREHNGTNANWRIERKNKVTGEE